MTTEKIFLPKTLEIAPISSYQKMDNKLERLIQITKSNDFNSLSEGNKRSIDLFIYESLSKEFEPENIMLSQNLEEYTKRDVIPELPMECNSYTELKNSIMYELLSKNQQKRVDKLIQIENNRIIPNQFPRKQKNNKMEIYKRSSGLVVMCADDTGF